MFLTIKYLSWKDVLCFLVLLMVQHALLFSKSSLSQIRLKWKCRANILWNKQLPLHVSLEIQNVCLWTYLDKKTLFSEIWLTWVFKTMNFELLQLAMPECCIRTGASQKGCDLHIPKNTTFLLGKKRCEIFTSILESSLLCPLLFSHLPVHDSLRICVYDKTLQNKWMLQGGLSHAITEELRWCHLNHIRPNACSKQVLIKCAYYTGVPYLLQMLVYCSLEPCQALNLWPLLTESCFRLFTVIQAMSAS